MTSWDEIVGCLPVAEREVIVKMTALFEDVGRQTEEFAGRTGLACQAGCGACCSTPEIETTVAEVMPLAVHLWARGLAQGLLERIGSQADGTCVLYAHDPADPLTGRCRMYAYRPGLCRLFGFAVRRDKYDKPLLATCKIIKDRQPQECARVQEALDRGLEAPLLSAYSFTVAGIDPVNGRKLLGINQAIKEALEKVGYHIEKIKQ